MSALDLVNTSLHGSIPRSFWHLPDLSYLDLSNNNLSGTLSEVQRLSSLWILDLSNNQLNEILPGTFRKLPHLETLLLSSNKFNQTINETHLSNLPALRVLDVSNNLISFNFSSIWISLSTLSYLNLSHNKIYEEWPKSIMKMKDYYTWDLSFNNLSGPIPYFPPKAMIIHLSNNKFSGTISSICATFQSRLSYLDMSSNLLSGRLPDCWRQLPFLRILKLANNNFSGTIPSSINILKNLLSIHFNNNNFSGKMPSLMNSTHLVFIDFGQNNLNGKLPSWIGHHLSNLIGLRLQANEFQGRIPTNLCYLPLLQILDLSQNNITGSIPHCFNNLSALSNIPSMRQTVSYDFFHTYSSTDIPASFFDNAVFAWKGQYDEYGKILGLLTIIDLSHNHLTGEIPSSITTLVALASLNLSRNNLVGFIPSNMGQMKMLESLDLSNNSLSGKIPISFSALSFLSVLNLSFNSLSGKIPIGTQLQGFDASSYIGNQGLCGLPLTKGCLGDGRSDPNPSRQNIDADRNDKLISFGFYVSMAFGFTAGFWGVCGTLILKSSWRHSFFQFFSNMNDWIYVQVVLFKAKIKRRFQE